MSVKEAASTKNSSHTPVLISSLISMASPINGTWIDGTFGAGGYTKHLLNAGADRVIGIDRDPSVFDLASNWLSLIHI